MDWPLTPLKPFGVVFMFDMAIRVTLGERWSPVLAIGRFTVRSREPQWVGASQKEFAWWFCFLMTLSSCAAIGLFGAPMWVSFTICGLYISFLFLEAVWACPQVADVFQSGFHEWCRGY
ncbi:DUF4395 family protein [Trueperella bialowiezensis]|uniref:DUF4395 domain-containing protein n=1 Tax=Trueperella bialowiezensis TaxID=312285 RepID=A0A448PF25_9ACTO|nr:DUF4395 family protein [Trueperella bialowiezensis]VEI13527.1 Uncharacterised protein [Trueperella bialowiezensis]